MVKTDFLLFFCNHNGNLSCAHILLIIQVDMPLNALPPTTSPENLATKVRTKPHTVASWEGFEGPERKFKMKTQRWLQPEVSAGWTSAFGAESSLATLTISRYHTCNIVFSGPAQKVSRKSSADAIQCASTKLSS